MSINMEEMLQLSSDKLAELNDKLTLVGIVLGKLALLEVVLDKDAGATAKAQAGKTLTQVGENPQTISERLKESQFADMTPEELRATIRKLSSGELTVNDFLEDGNS